MSDSAFAGRATLLASLSAAQIQPSWLSSTCPAGVQAISPHLRKGAGSFATASDGVSSHTSLSYAALGDVAARLAARRSVERKIENLRPVMAVSLSLAT